MGGRMAVAAAAPGKRLDFEVLPTPRPTRVASTRPRNLGWGHAIAVLRGDGSQAAAKFAAAFTSDPKYTGPWFAKAGLPPTTTSGLASAEVQNDKYTKSFAAWIGDFAEPDPFWVYPQYAARSPGTWTSRRPAYAGPAADPGWASRSTRPPSGD